MFQFIIILNVVLCHAPQVFYFVWGNCLVAFGFVISTFFRVVKNAVVFGYIYTIGSGVPKCLPGTDRCLTATGCGRISATSTLAASSCLTMQRQHVRLLRLD